MHVNDILDMYLFIPPNPHHSVTSIFSFLYGVGPFASGSMAVRIISVLSPKGHQYEQEMAHSVGQSG